MNDITNMKLNTEKLLVADNYKPANANYAQKCKLTKLNNYVYYEVM